MQGGLNPQSCAALWAAGGSMGSDAFYNARGLLWESLPRPANAVDALESRLSLPHLPHARRAESPMGSGAPCLGCCLRKDSPAPKARIACGFNPAGQPAFMPRPAGAESFMGSDTFYNARRLLWTVPRRRRA